MDILLSAMVFIRPDRCVHCVLAGLYLLFKPDLFGHFDKVYMMLKRFGERSWGSCWHLETVGLLNVLWFARVSFTLHGYWHGWALRSVFVSCTDEPW